MDVHTVRHEACGRLVARIGERRSIHFPDRRFAGVFLPAPDNDIREFRVQFDETGHSSGFLRRDERGSRTAERIENDVPRPGRISDSPLNQLDGFHRGV